MLDDRGSVRVPIFLVLRDGTLQPINGCPISQGQRYHPVHTHTVDDPTKHLLLRLRAELREHVLNVVGARWGT